MKIDNPMLEGPILPTLVRMATPQALGFLVQSSVSIAEIWFIGRLGTTGLAAMALVFPLLMLVQMLSGGAFGGAVTGTTARTLGAGNIERAQALIWNVVYLAFLLSIFLLALDLLFGEEILRALGGEAQVLEAARQYTTILFPFCFLIWLSNMLMGVVRGTGNMKLPATLMVAGAFIQVPLSGALILGLGPFPQLGITGAAISILSVSAFNILVLVYLHTRQESVPRFTRQQMGFRTDLISDILSIGALSAISPFATVFTILILTGLVGQFGMQELAGYGIASRVEFLVIPLVFGLGVSMNSMVGRNIGHGNYDRAEKIGWIGAACAAAVAGSVGILLAIFPLHWVNLFSDEEKTVQVAASYFRITAPFYGFFGAGLALYFASQGARAVGWPIIATLLRFLIAVVGSWFLIEQMNGGIEELFVCVGAGMFVYGTLTLLALYLGSFRKTQPK